MSELQGLQREGTKRRSWDRGIIDPQFRADSGPRCSVALVEKTNAEADGQNRRPGTM
jgi:hypothetical protein